MSAPIKLSPSRPLKIVRNSRVDHPPVSGVPVAGATESQTSALPTHLCVRKNTVLTSRVQRVDVQAKIDRVLGADAVADLLDDPVGADRVDLARLDNLKAAVAVVLVVRRPAQRCADAGVDVGVVLEQALLRSMVEVRAVVDGRDLGG